MTRRMWGVNVKGPDQPEEMVANNKTHEQIPRFMLNYKKRAEMLREPLQRAWKSWIAAEVTRRISKANLHLFSASSAATFLDGC